MGKPSKSTQTDVKRTVKYLSVCRNPNIARLVVKDSSPAVIRTICNAALNAQRGDVFLSPSVKASFRRNRRAFDILIDRKRSIESKRRFITQRGSGFLGLLAPLLGTVLGSIGSAIFGPKQQQ